MSNPYKFRWYSEVPVFDPEQRGRSFQFRSDVEKSRVNDAALVLPRVFDKSMSVGLKSCEEDGMPVALGVCDKWPGLATTSPVIFCEGDDSKKIDSVCPNIGVILLGDASPGAGTHNVVIGLYQYLSFLYGKVNLIGFLDGPQGLANNIFFKLDWSRLCNYVNQGGSDLLGFGSLKAIDLEQFEEILTLCKRHKLHSLVFIGGPDELSHTAQLSHYMMQLRENDRVNIISVFQSPNCSVYVPKWLPITLGFDSARTVLSEVAGNVAIDNLSSGKSVNYHFVRCGSSTVTFEVSLQIRPVACIAAEEIKLSGKRLDEIVNDVSDVIVKRYREYGLRSGTVLISDGFWEALREMKVLQDELIVLERADLQALNSLTYTLSKLSEEAANLLKSFPKSDALCLLRSFDDNQSNSLAPPIHPEKLIAWLVRKNIAKRRDPTTFAPVMPVPSMRVHYLGREARCPIPTDFDCKLGYTLGLSAGVLALNQMNGFVASVTNLLAPSSFDWICGGFPISCMIKSPTSVNYDEKHETDDWIRLSNTLKNREANVPQVNRRSLDPVSDHVLALYNLVRFGSDAAIPHCRQPGPYQFFGKAASPSCTLMAAYMEPQDILKEMRRSSSCQVLLGQEPLLHLTSNFPSSPSLTPRDLVHLPLRDPRQYSESQVSRLDYHPRLPSCVKNSYQVSQVEISSRRTSLNILQLAFPNTFNTIGVEIICQEAKQYKWKLNACKIPKAMNDKKVFVDISGRSIPMRQVPVEEIAAASPRRLVRTSGLRIGAVFLGRQSPGCHNILTGLFDFLDGLSPKGELVGFLFGALGFIKGHATLITRDVISRYRNQSGLDLIGRTGLPLKTRHDLISCARTASKLKLDGVVVIGGLGGE